MSGVANLSAKQAGQIDGVLSSLVSDAGVICVLVVDADGHLIAQSGDTGTIDPVAFGALISANFAATQQVAQQMGEKDFKAVYHEGENKDIFLRAIGDLAVLVNVFPQETTLGMVKVFADKAAETIMETFEAGGGSDEGLSVGGGFAGSALAELDKVLGG